MSIPTDDLNGAFWLTIAGIVSALVASLLKAMYKSKCNQVDLCCIKISRDIDAEVQEDMAQPRKKSIDSSNAEVHRLPRNRSV